MRDPLPSSPAGRVRKSSRRSASTSTVCAREGCDQPLGELATLHGDPFHSAKCCRAYHEIDSSDELIRENLGSKRFPRHGTTWMYRKHHCRCRLCREAVRNQKRRERLNPDYLENERKRMAARRERYANDPVYREKILAKNRERWRKAS